VLAMVVGKETIEDLKALLGEYKGKTVMVTGATGMIGQNIVALLEGMNSNLGAGINIIAQCRNSDKASAVFKDYSDSHNIQYVYCDIVNLPSDLSVDYVIHTASVTGGSKQHLLYPMNTISVALEGTKRVLDLTLKNKARAIFLSSLEVYGYTGFDFEIIKESDGGYIDPTNPRSSYSESKRMCECMFASYAKQYGLMTYIARLTATFGRGVSQSDKRVFAQFANAVKDGQDIILRSTGESARNYCDCEDAAKALLFIMSRGVPGEAYNVANPDTEITIKDLARLFIKVSNSKSKVIFDLSEDATSFGYNSVMRNVLDSKKLLNLGWKPRYGLDMMINHLIAE